MHLDRFSLVYHIYAFAKIEVQRVTAAKAY